MRSGDAPPRREPGANSCGVGGSLSWKEASLSGFMNSSGGWSGADAVEETGLNQEKPREVLSTQSFEASAALDSVTRKWPGGSGPGPLASESRGGDSSKARLPQLPESGQRSRERRK